MGMKLFWRYKWRIKQGIQKVVVLQILNFIRVFFNVNGKIQGRKQMENVDIDFIQGYSLVLGKIFLFKIFKVRKFYIGFQQESRIVIKGKFVYFFLVCVFRDLNDVF